MYAVGSLSISVTKPDAYFYVLRYSIKFAAIRSSAYVSVAWLDASTCSDVSCINDLNSDVSFAAT